MKSNAIEYLNDVGFKRIDSMFSVVAFHRSLKLEDLLSRKEKIKVKTRNGLAIQVVDRRAQYEKRKQQAEIAGLGF